MLKKFITFVTTEQKKNSAASNNSNFPSTNKNHLMNYVIDNAPNTLTFSFKFPISVAQVSIMQSSFGFESTDLHFSNNSPIQCE